MLKYKAVRCILKIYLQYSILYCRPYYLLLTDSLKPAQYEHSPWSPLRMLKILEVKFFTLIVSFTMLPQYFFLILEPLIVIH